MKKSVMKNIGIFATITGLIMSVGAFILIWALPSEYYSGLRVMSEVGSSTLGLGIFLGLCRGNLLARFRFGPLTQIPGLVENDELKELAQETIAETSDERGIALNEKAGWVAFWVLLGLLWIGSCLSASLAAGDLFLPWSRYLMWLLSCMEVTAIITYLIARAWWNKRM